MTILSMVDDEAI